MARWAWLHYHLDLESRVVKARWAWLNYHLDPENRVVKARWAWLHYHLALESRVVIARWAWLHYHLTLAPVSTIVITLLLAPRRQGGNGLNIVPQYTQEHEKVITEAAL